MSRRLLALIALAFMAVSAYAIPARPGFRTFTQPDGKSLFLEQKGDEWGSWFTDKSGARHHGRERVFPPHNGETAWIFEA